MIYKGKQVTFKRIYRAFKWHFGDIFFRHLFGFWQSLGFHVTRNHFYQPIPDTRTLKDELWTQNSEMAGVDLNEKKQLELLELFQNEYKKEYLEFPDEFTGNPTEYYVNNGAYESVDGEILYCMVRHFQPSKIIEIGSGNTTLLSAQAILKNETETKKKCELTSIEPYPNDLLKSGFPGLYKQIPQKVQEIPLNVFAELNENDILFIDSSHILTINSDVQYEFLEIIPRLKKGVLIHVHDIFFPAEYPKKLVKKDLIFFNEQYLLQSFLAFNDSFEVLWGGTFMHIKHPEKLEKAFSSYNRETRIPGSFWMRKIQ